MKQANREGYLVRMSVTDCKFMKTEHEGLCAVSLLP